MAYVWLFAVSGYYFARCLIDLALVRRPALNPNLGLAGLAWLAGTLYVSLVAVAVFRSDSVGRGAGSVEREDRVDSPGEGPASHAPPTTSPPPRSLWVGRGLNLACYLATAIGLLLVGRAHFEDLHAGIAACALYLLLPYTHWFLVEPTLDVPVWEHAWPAALLVWAVLAYRRPGLAGGLVGLAAGTVFFPVCLLPAWISFYGRRGAGRFLAGFACAVVGCLATLGVLWFLREGLPYPLPSPWPQAAWLPWLPPEGAGGLWQNALARWVYRVPIFLSYAAFLLATAFWPSPKNLAHLISLTAALLIGIQFWYADRGGVYVFWYLPFLLLLMFRPNLSGATAEEKGVGYRGGVP